MKKQKVSKYFSLAALLFLAVVFSSACAPPFFVSTSAESPVEVGPGAAFLAGLFGDMTSKYQVDGTMNQGAQKTGEDFCLYIDIGGSGERDLLVWDGTDWQNVTDDDDAAEALDAIVDNGYIHFKPDLDLSSVYIYWADYSTSTPELCIDVSDIDEIAGYEETLYTVIVESKDASDHDIWRVDTGSNNFYMAPDRRFYFRAGKNSDTSLPVVKDLNFECDDSERVDINFSPQITFGETMGALYAFLVDENGKGFTLANSGHSISSGDHTYWWALPADRDFNQILLEYDTQYKFVIWDKNNSTTLDPSLIPPNLPLSQDMNGNVIYDQYNLLEGPIDINDIDGPEHDDIGILVYYQCFYTIEEPE